RRGISDRAGPAGQDQEGCLETVLGPLRAAQDASTNAPDERSVAADQRREGFRIVARRVALQQAGVGRLPVLLVGRELAELADNGSQGGFGHGQALRSGSFYPGSGRRAVFGFWARENSPDSGCGQPFTAPKAAKQPFLCSTSAAAKPT